MNISERLKERFCKDLNLPIKIYIEPYFTERLQLFDELYNCIEKYNEFIKLVERCGGEQEYFQLYNKVKDDAINYLNENEYMRFFAQEEDFSKYKVKNVGFPKKDIYHANNDGKTFISFDMKKGNFTALRHYDERIVKSCQNYEDFLGFFTKESHLIYSKYIRQVIFGNVNPRRQVAYEQYLMDKVLDKILKHFNPEQVVFFSTDEIILEIEDKEILIKKDIVENIVTESVAEKINIRAEFFELRKISGTDGFIKKILIGEKDYEIKGVNNLKMPFVLRKIKGEEYKDSDFVFIHEDMLVNILKAPEINISL
jgi:hypothetical protein